MDRKWLYPYYVIALLVLVLYFFGCDSRSSSSFSVEVQVENDEGTPIDGATVGLRPCYDTGQDVWCADGPPYSRTRAASERKAVELVAWDVRVDEGAALLAWTTASETDNAGFRVEKNAEGIGGFEQIEFVDGQGTTDESTDYRYRTEELSREEHAFRLVAVASDGSSNVVGEPDTVRISPSDDAVIRPPSPNPVRQRAVFDVAVSEASAITSTVHTLNGEKIQTIVQEEISTRGTHRYVWHAGNVPAGLYEHRTQIRTDGDIVARDTAYVAVAGTGSLGATDADGTVSTTDRTRFPALYDVPTIEVRDENQILLDTMQVSPTVEFAVTTENGRQTFQRTVSEGENTLTLSVSP